MFLQPLPRETKIKLVCLIVLTGFIVAIVYHAYQGIFLQLPYPFNTFLFLPLDRFNDFYNGFYTCKNFNPYFEPGYFWPLRAMFPFLYFIYCLMALFDGKTMLVLLLVSSFAFIFYINYKNCQVVNKTTTFLYALILSCLSYPVIFTLDRANTESWLYILLYFAVSFFHQQKYTKSAIFFSFVFAMKPFPAIFGILFVGKKRFKEILLMIFLTLFLTIVPLFSFKSGFWNNLNHLRYSLDDVYPKNYILQHGGLAYGNSLWGVIKITHASLATNIKASNLEALIPIYSPMYSLYNKICWVMLALVLLYVLLVEQTFWKKIALLTFSMNLLPAVSGDYKLLYVFIPLFLFINFSKKSRWDFVYLVLFSLLLIPKNYDQFVFPNLFINKMANIGIVINPMLMSLISFLIIAQGLNRLRQRLRNKPISLSTNS